ncbi:bifunctional phosphoribosyl-AMP cyclohydrolase/phosphoribosyl-ATP diphosphatase HisIE [Fluviicola sp.]|uniref:bifunctional phosphoribosyl-AMP cyclohydrolase/phosphoribosyl-ATP diphosphatase HisIE n=1 Tax=Fluviicola sp. TaxID=1917219 RepID=UPI0026219CAF|nr:bifunctional phosphoribosyl-AMP cyclohydrolase/phosphoribosyl-ATP diphosphatase HisIE [Fluviicola sp.]
MKYDNTGVIPAIIQHAKTKEVLMLGYMNEEAFELTRQTGQVTFFSRSRNKIWVKGESSGNRLILADWKLDCDQDALLIQVLPVGPTCHKGTSSCWGETVCTNFSVLEQLIETIETRFSIPKEGSYVQSLIEKGIPKIAQKVGEEGVELVIEAMRNESQLFKEEAADLLFHYLILLKAKGVDFKDVLEILQQRSNL